MAQSGTLYVCATPIGNLEDITLRALRILREVSVIAAEDTRHTRKLLRHFDISTPLLSMHEHNEAARVTELLARLQDGQSVALVSDAGMPTISDPGGHLIEAAVHAGLDVVVVPGPTAFVTALVGSGLPTDRFAFEGFLPRQARARRDRLQTLASDPRTLVFYEAPHRLRRVLRDMYASLGDRPACVARELTKVFEQWHRGPLSELVEYWDDQTPRGEFVIVVAGATAEPSAGSTTTASSTGATTRAMTATFNVERWTDAKIAAHVKQRMLAGEDKKTAVRSVADELDLPRRTVYQAAIAIDALLDGQDGNGGA